MLEEEINSNNVETENRRVMLIIERILETASASYA